MSTYFLLIFTYFFAAIRRFSYLPCRRKQKTSEVFTYCTGHQIAMGFPIELGREDGPHPTHSDRLDRHK